MDAPHTETKQKIEDFRKEFIEELPSLAREMIDTARAEATTAAYEKLLNTAMKVVEGVQVDQKRDQYANLPVIHVSFGPDMGMATTVTIAQQPEAPALIEAEDVTPKSPFATSASSTWSALPDDPLELLSAPADPEEAAVLETLNLAASAMALD